MFHLQSPLQGVSRQEQLSDEHPAPVTAPRRAAGPRTRRPLGKVVQHRIREGQDGLGLDPNQTSPQSLPSLTASPHPLASDHALEFSGAALHRGS